MKHNSVNANSTTQPWKKDKENIGKIKLCILKSRLSSEKHMKLVHIWIRKWVVS